MPTDLLFATQFAEKAGAEMVKFRKTTNRRKKLDRTDVTGEDKRINKAFIVAVRAREGGHASVHGEEYSEIVKGARRFWVIDPVDGIGEYVNDSVPDGQRTTCVGISLLYGGRLMLSVVYNPFRHEMFTAQHGEATKLNGGKITCSPQPLRRGGPYDYCHWDDVRFDMRGLNQRIGRPRGVYSAIYQAVEVAAGRSTFAAFPGDTIHDIAPGALLVANAGGLVTDLKGRPLDWNDLNHGVLYASKAAYPTAIRAIARCL